MRKKRKPEDFIQRSEFTGTREELNRFIAENLRYPSAAREKGTEGTVIVSYAVNDNGKVLQARVTHGIGDGCDEEALRIVKLLRFRKVKNRGHKVMTNRTIGIKFSLNKNTPTQFAYVYTPSETKNEDALDPREEGKSAAQMAKAEPQPQPQNTRSYGYTLNYTYKPAEPEQER